MIKKNKLKALIDQGVFAQIENFPEIENHNLNANLLNEIKKPAFFLANLFQIFGVEIIKTKQKLDLENLYDLGFYLGFYIYCEYWKEHEKNKYQNKTFKLKKEFLNFKQNDVLLSKMFNNLKCLEKLRFFLPKEYNIFFMYFIKKFKH